jgi:hypothetical protein
MVIVSAVQIDLHIDLADAVGTVEEELPHILDSDNCLKMSAVGRLKVDGSVGQMLGRTSAAKRVESIVVEELIPFKEFIVNAAVRRFEDWGSSVVLIIRLLNAHVMIRVVINGRSDLTQHSIVSHIAIVYTDKVPILLLFVVVKIPLNLISADVVGKLVGNGIVVELDRYEREHTIEGIALRGDVGDGHIPDEDGEDQTDDGCEYLAAVGAGLPLLDVQIFNEQRLDLMTRLGLTLHGCRLIIISSDAPRLYITMNLN